MEARITVPVRSIIGNSTELGRELLTELRKRNGEVDQDHGTRCIKSIVGRDALISRKYCQIRAGSLLSLGTLTSLSLARCHIAVTEYDSGAEHYVSICYVSCCTNSYDGSSCGRPEDQDRWADRGR